MNAIFITVAYTIATIGIGSGVSLLLVAFRYPSYIRGTFNTFGLSKILVAIGFLVAAMRPDNWVLTLAPVANGVAVAGLFLNYVAVRKLQQKPDYGWLTAVVGLSVAAISAVAIQMFPAAGVEGARLVSGVFVVFVLGAVTYELLFRYPNTGIAHWICGVLSLAISTAFTIRLGWMFAQILQHGGIPPGWGGLILVHPLERWLYLVIILGTVISTINFVLLASDEMNKELSLLAHTDPLTGILNRRRFMEMGEAEFRRARRFGKPLTLLIFDIDRFKAINDSYGHPFGDRAIQSVANTAASCLREGDQVGRIGGEEFAVLLLETSRHLGEGVAERLRLAVAGVDLMTDNGAIAVIACSVGGVSLDMYHENFQNMVADADAAMYAAKKNGRNRTFFALPRGEMREVALSNPVLINSPLVNPSSGYAT